MGQTKTKFDCPLCGSQAADQDDGCDSPPPLKAEAPFAVSFYVSDDVTTDAAYRCTSGDGGGSYVALPLTSVAEETSTSGDMTNDASMAPSGLAPNHSSSLTSTSTASGRQNAVVMRGNIRHHGYGGHRVR